MLILESLLFLHGTSYPSDSLLYSVSKQKNTTFTLSPAYENLKKWSYYLPEKDEYSLDFHECFNLAQLPIQLQPVSVSESKSSSSAHLVHPFTSFFTSIVCLFLLFTRSSFFPSTYLNPGQFSGHRPSPSSINPRLICTIISFL